MPSLRLDVTGHNVVWHLLLSLFRFFCDNKLPVQVIKDKQQQVTMVGQMLESKLQSAQSQ